jgi:hypothetical protein
VISTWFTLKGGLGFSGDGSSRHVHRTAPVWLRRLAARRIPAWLRPSTVSRWAAAAHRHTAHRHRVATHHRRAA